MRILIFCWRDIKNPEAGGAEVFLHQIAKRCVYMGHKVTVFTSMFENARSDELYDGVEIIRRGSKFSIYLEARRFYKKYFSKQNYDVLIDVVNTLPFFAPGFVKNNEKVFALIYQLCKEIWYYETRFPLSFIGMHLLEPLSLRRYRNVLTITISESSKNDLNSLKIKDVFIVPIGLNSTKLKKISGKEENPTLLFVGRFKNAKCPEHAIKAFEIVKKQMPSAVIWMVGDGYLKPHLEMKYRYLKDIKFYGKISEEVKFDLMKRAWVLLVPGIREGWGLVVTEANSMGTPAVGYRINGLVDSILDGETGLICDNNPASMAEKTLLILESKGLRTELSNNSINFASNFDWDRTAKIFMDILEKYRK
jgi:glycosyltransferase involved in cell wall biosynthesis